MAKFKLEIKTTTGAFGDFPEQELQRILRDLADNIEPVVFRAEREYTLIDHLGNTVGKATWS
jgi:hypothetical protein